MILLRFLLALASLCSCLEICGGSEGALRVIFSDEKSNARPCYAKNFRKESTLSQNEFLLPAVEGCWIALWVGELEEYFYVPYRGGDVWEIVVEGDLVWLRSDEEKSLIGLFLDEKKISSREDLARFLEGVDLSRVGEVLTIGTDEMRHFDFFDAFPQELRLAVSAPGTPTPEQYDRLSKLNLVGLDLDQVPKAAELERLPNLKSLEYLCVRLSNRDAKNLVMPPLPGLKHLVTFGASQKILWNTTLAGYPDLETVVMRGGRYPQHRPKEVIRSLSDNPKLKLLEIECPGRIFDLAALADAPQLEYLWLDGQSIVAGPEGIAAISSLKNLRCFHFNRFGLSQERLDEWAESGGLGQVVHFSGTLIPPLGALPNIGILSATSYDWQPEFPDWTRVAGAPPKLRKVSANALSGEEIDALAAVLPDQVEALDFNWVEFEQPEDLYQFSGVRSLIVYGNGIKFPVLDVLKLEGLVRFDLSSNTTVRSVVSIPQHPTLQYVELKYLRSLSDLGDAAQNDRLLHLSLRGLPALNSLAAFSKTTGVKSMRIEDLDGLTDVGSVLDGNDSLVRLRIDKSRGLKNVHRYSAR